MFPEMFEPMFPVSKWLHTLTLDPASVELRHFLEPRRSPVKGPVWPRELQEI